MTIESLVLASGTPFFTGVLNWLHDSYTEYAPLLVKNYHTAQAALIGGSLAIVGLSFTAFGTLMRIKDKVYDAENYQARVLRMRAIDADLDPFQPYEQLLESYHRARLVAAGSALFQLIIGWLSYTWVALTGFGLIIWAVLYMVHVTRLFSKTYTSR